MNSSLKGAMIAAAVAGMFASGCEQKPAEEGQMGAKEASLKCEGGNACKGQGACNGVSHDCAGKNECKGKGWINVKSEEECTRSGGKIAG